jgi:hypothetical protein
VDHVVEQPQEHDSIARRDIEARPLVDSSGTDVVNDVRREGTVLARHRDRR